MLFSKIFRDFSIIQDLFLSSIKKQFFIMWLPPQLLHKRFERLLNRFLASSPCLIVLARLLRGRDRGSCGVSGPMGATARSSASSGSFSANSGASIPKYEGTTVEKADRIVFVFEWRRVCCCLRWSYFRWIFLLIWMKRWPATRCTCTRCWLRTH